MVEDFTDEFKEVLSMKPGPFFSPVPTAVDPPLLSCSYYFR